MAGAEGMARRARRNVVTDKIGAVLPLLSPVLASLVNHRNTCILPSFSN